MDEVNKKVGLKIREYRKKRGLTQEQLALEAGLHRAYIGQIERGEKNMGVKNLHRIATALKIPPAKLLE